MPNYIASASFFSREKNRRYEAGDLVEDLPVAFYEKYRVSHPGLLRPAPMNAMGMPMQIRSEVAPAPVTVPVAEPEPPQADEAPAEQPEPAAEEVPVAPEAEEAPADPAPSDAPAVETGDAEKGAAKPKPKARAKK